ncbi:MAG: phosphoribosyl-AMP cyclohydrolase [Pseudomonadota bacterium]
MLPHPMLVRTFLFAAALAVSSTAFANLNITEAEVLDTQQRWGDGIVRIGKVQADGGDYVREALEHIEDLYDYGEGQVLFKPTLASTVPHRPTIGGALSYFVGYDSAIRFLGTMDEDERASLKVYKEDGGFATNPWTKVRFENEGIVLYGTTAVAMGNYYFTDPSGVETKVHYTLGFVKRGDDVNIYVQESNLPFQPE